MASPIYGTGISGMMQMVAGQARGMQEQERLSRIQQQQDYSNAYRMWGDRERFDARERDRSYQHEWRVYEDAMRRRKEEIDYDFDAYKRKEAEGERDYRRGITREQMDRAEEHRKWQRGAADAKATRVGLPSPRAVKSGNEAENMLREAVESGDPEQVRLARQKIDETNAMLAGKGAPLIDAEALLQRIARVSPHNVRGEPTKEPSPSDKRRAHEVMLKRLMPMEEAGETGWGETLSHAAFRGADTWQEMLGSTINRFTDPYWNLDLFGGESVARLTAWNKEHRADLIRLERAKTIGIADKTDLLKLQMLKQNYRSTVEFGDMAPSGDWSFGSRSVQGRGGQESQRGLLGDVLPDPYDMSGFRQQLEHRPSGDRSPRTRMPFMMYGSR